MKPYIVAELGSNPASRDWFLQDYIGAARDAGASAVKIQLWHSSHFPKEEQASKEELEFPRRLVKHFAELAHRYGLEVGASVFDEDAVRLAAEHLDFLKLAARERKNFTLYHACYSTCKRMHCSTNEVNDIYTRGGRADETVMFAISEYPTALFRAVIGLLNWHQTITICRRRAFGPRKWGWSSHTRSIWDCVLAAKLGASVIEKHFDLDGKGSEAGHSLLPQEFARMVRWCK